MNQSINQQMQDLHVQARIAQSAGIERDWSVAQSEIDTLYALADDIEADIARHPKMPEHEKANYLREVENATWGAHLPIAMEIKKNGKLGVGPSHPEKWVRKI